MLVELERAGRVTILRLRRPERANALNRALLEEFLNLQEELRHDPKLPVLITVGEGKGYCAGSDLEELSMQSSEEALEGQRFEARVCRNLLCLPQPTIAAVHGYAFGGGLCLAAYHDFRVIAAKTRLGLPEVKLGWNPTFGTRRLAQIVGAATAQRWAMSAEEVSVAEALAAGLATTVVGEEDEVLRAALELGRRLADLPAEGLAAMKESAWQQTGRELEQADEIEARLFQRCLAGEHAQSTLRRFKKTSMQNRKRA